MQLHVAHADWGEILPNHLEKLLKYTVSHLNELFRPPFQGRIHVVPSPPGKYHLVFFIARLRMIHMSSGYPLVIIFGANLHTNLRTSFVMCYLGMSA